MKSTYNTIMKCIVTGGAGFIGSHLADSLIRQGHEVVVIDSLVSGVLENVPNQAKLIKKDISQDDIAEDIKGADAFFHFAADPDVRSSAENPAESFRHNVVGTFNVLEACRATDVRRFIFASTSTVYGETDVIPTPETHETRPISNYGASKLACESYVASFANSYGLQSTVLRFANIYGPRSTHGVIFDFFHKLKKDPARLEILGDGKQEKSYLYIDDTISGIITAFENTKKEFDVFNIGSGEKTTVSQIADIVSKTLDTRPKTVFTGGKRGWAGDVRTMLLDISRIRALGWEPKIPFGQGAERYIGWLRQRDG